MYIAYVWKFLSFPRVLPLRSCRHNRIRRVSHVPLPRLTRFFLNPIYIPTLFVLLCFFFFFLRDFFFCEAPPHRVQGPRPDNVLIVSIWNLVRPIHTLYVWYVRVYTYYIGPDHVSRCGHTARHDNINKAYIRLMWFINFNFFFFFPPLCKWDKKCNSKNIPFMRVNHSITL